MALTPPALPKAQKPARHLAWTLYQVYCVLTFLMHMAVVFGVWWVYQNTGPLFWQSGSPQDPEMEAITTDLFRKLGVFLLGSSLFFGICSLAILRFRGTKEAWVTHLINLALGGLTGVLLPLALPVFILMMSEDFKEWFIRAPAAPPAP